ncbi:MAG: hypothetical protein JWO38_4742 [Gemmataceae bacterium]|nr:hypothetical protein [Gemmataceae bacterium]
MIQTERDTLKVDVPVGFLLSEPREILVSVDRPADTPLSIRLRLIPAEVEGLADIGSTPTRSDHNTPMPVRRLARKNKPDGYADHEYGGGD